MNVTKDGLEDRQLHIEDYLQMVSAEQKEYAEVSAHQRITENNDIIADFQTDNLMEQILHKDNLNKAYKKVKSNKGAGGVDGMSVDELLDFLKDNQKWSYVKKKYKLRMTFSILPAPYLASFCSNCNIFFQYCFS